VIGFRLSRLGFLTSGLRLHSPLNLISLGVPIESEGEIVSAAAKPMSWAENPGRLALRLLGNASLILPTLYVLGFIYLKSYFAVFGFDVELASLSVTNLLLAHRYFAGQDFFFAAGALQAILLLQVSDGPGLLDLPAAEKAKGVVVLFFPVILTAIAYPLAIWSERNVPAGYNPRNVGLIPAMLLAWLSGAALTAVVRWLVRSREWSFSYALVVLGALALAAVAVASYRWFAISAGTDRLVRLDFQEVSVLEPSPSPTGAPVKVECRLVYSDTQNLFMLCGDQKAVYLRSGLSKFVVKPKK
jgi:hypothetical protein